MDNINKLKSSLKNTKEKTESSYYDLKGKLEETGEKIKDKTQEILEEGREQFSSLEHQAMVYEEAFINKIRERPIASLLVAAGAGYLLSKLLK